MLSFPRLGIEVQLGNQMFQYAFVRSSAQKLGTQFYCRPWSGDKIFDLKDERERAEKPEGIIHYYEQAFNNPGLVQDAFDLQDNTEIFGFFQSEKYYDKPRNVKQWFSFKEDNIAQVREKFDFLDGFSTVGIHLRFGDVVGQLKRPPMRRSYYKKALTYIPDHKRILVFSNDPKMAQDLLAGLSDKFLFIQGNKHYEDLYLMTQCRHFICSYSTFCWWGAWLGNFTDRVIIFPKEGQYRLGYGYKAEGTCCENWLEIPSLRPFWDDYRVASRLEKRLPASLRQFLY